MRNIRISFSLISLISNALVKFKFLDYFKNLENLTLIAMLFLSLGLLVRQEKLLDRLKKH